MKLIVFLFPTKCLLLLFVLMHVSLLCLSQTNTADIDVSFYAPKRFKPSHEAAALIQYVDIPVSHYSGVPNISIPIETIKVDAFELPISISYHASGIKLDQEATSVGLGWTLNAGGMISRVINEVNDFQIYYDVPTKIKIANNEPDYYYYNFGKYSGRFYCKDYNEDKHEYTNFIVSNPEDNLRIYTDKSIFVITSPDNIEYRFEEVEAKQTFYVSGSPHESFYIHNGGIIENATFGCPDFNENLSRELFNSTSSLVTGWYLTQIKLPNGKTIDFTYTLYSNSYVSPLKRSNKEFKHLYEYKYPGFSYLFHMEYFNYYHSIETCSIENLSTLPILSKISWDNGFISFIPSTTPRKDLRGFEESYALDRIVLHSIDGKVLKTFKLNHSYFQGDRQCSGYKHFLGSQFLVDRLKLDSITVCGSKDHHYSYKMEYDESIPLHSKCCLGGDKWNYFTGECGNIPYFVPFVADSAIYQRKWNPEEAYYKRETSRPIKLWDVDYSKLVMHKGENRLSSGIIRVKPTSNNNAKAWMLTRFVTPTAGAIDFKYECNEIYNGDIETSKETNPIETHKFTLAYHDDLSRTFNLNIPANCSYIKLICKYDGGAARYETGTDIIRITGAINCIQTGIPDGLKNTGSDSHEQYTFTKYIPIQNVAGKCQVELNKSKEDFAQIQVTIQIYNEDYTYKTEKVGGVRIAEIRNGDTYRKFNYTSLYGEPSGVLTYEPCYSQMRVDMYTSTYPFRTVFGEVTYLEFQSTPLESLLNPFTNNFMGYSHVIEEKYNDTRISKEYMSYYNKKNENKNPLEIADQLSFNGKLKRRIVFNDNIPLKDEQFVYDTVGVASLRATKDITSFLISASPYFYKISSYHTFLKEQQLKRYDLTGKLLQNQQTYYTYSPKNYQVSSIRRVTDGEQETTQKIKYMRDILMPGNQAAWMSLNPTLPIEETFFKNGNLTKRIVHTYKDSKITMPHTTHTFYNRGVPFPPTSNVIANPMAYQPEVIYDNYLQDGHNLSLKSLMGQSLVTIWGYNSQYIIAQIVNATLQDVMAAGIDPYAIARKNEPTASDWEALFNLRRYLPNASTTIYKHQPLIGITNQYDPNGREWKYIYDDLGRLSQVIEHVDGKRNLINQYEYHYATGK